MKLKDKVDSEEVMPTITIAFYAESLEKLLLDVRDYLIDNQMDFVWYLNFSPNGKWGFAIDQKWECRLTFFDANIEDEANYLLEQRMKNDL
jgi:hypothetical protein